MNHRNFTYIKIICNLSIFVISLLLVIVFLPKLLVFFMPFVVAWIIAWIATPIVRFVERHLKLKRKMSMVFIVVVIISGVIAAIYNISMYLGQLIASFLADLPQIWKSIQMETQGIFQILFRLLDKLPGEGTTVLEDFISDGGDYVGELMSSLSVPTISAVGSIASKVPDMIIFMIMCVIATYFFVVEREMIFQKLHDLTPKGIRDLWSIVKKCVAESIGGYFKAQFKIEIWIYLLIFIGLLILNVKYAVIIALGIAVLDFLPVFGTGAVLWPWTLIEFINGDYFSAIGLLLIWGISQLVRQFIQPKFVGDTLGVHPIPTLFLLFIGYKLAGVFGMIIAVPLGILAVTLYKEGVFKNAEHSVILLVGRLNALRRYDEKELEELKAYQEKREE